MTNQPMRGVKVVEVAQFTFTPAAGAVLADWGADVIKIEHHEMGDAQRGLQIGTGGVKAGNFQPLMEHPNRGKRSIGLNLAHEDGRKVLYDMVADADVFVTNFLPDARTRLKIEVEDIRAVNPDVVYVRGSAFGVKGEEATKGGFDSSAFWSRAGSAVGCTPSDSPRPMGMPAGAYGDSMGGMTIAGGIAAALFARSNTGETSVVDVSLLSVGTWAMALSVNNAMLMGEPPPQMPLEMPSMLAVNPLLGNFKTSDDRWINLTMLQAFRYWEDACRHLGLEDLIGDERFDTAEKLMANALDAGEYVTKAIAAKPFAHWREKFRTMEGQWAALQDPLELSEDPQVVANGYIVDVTDDAGETRKLVASPVQFDETPFSLRRAPQFAEQTDDILRELGLADDAIMQLKIDGVVT